LPNNLKYLSLAKKMAQWVRVLVTKPDDGLSFILGIHMVEGDSDSCKLSSDPHMCTLWHVHTLLY
ncbi:hypothetical protein ACQP3L_37705, partial [Escherichia coli]